MMYSPRTRFLVALVFLFAAGIAEASWAATWTVEKDGSGDFTIIQDAVDAAAPGDSILIGPGRYDTFRTVTSTVDEFQLSAVVWVKTAGLTIVGAGQGNTLIGPEVYTHEVNGRPAGAVYLDGGCGQLVFQRIGIENTQGNFSVRDNVALIEDVRSLALDPRGLASMSLLRCVGTVVRNCEFVGENGLITGTSVERVTIESCRFTGTSVNGTGFSIGNGAQDCILRDCTTDGGGVGISVYLGAVALIERCEVIDADDFAVAVTDGIAEIRNSRIGITQFGLRVTGRAEVYDSLLEGGTDYTVFSTGDVVIRNSHILNAGGLSLLGSTSKPGEQNDLRYNWWGTDDETLIESWIVDEDGTVLWQPIEPAPVSAKPRSVGSVKGRFRGQ